LVKDENGDLLEDSCNILNRWKNYFSHLLNVHRVSVVRQREIHTSEPSPFKVETATAKSKRYQLQGTDQILAELIQAGSETEFPQQWKESIIVLIYMGNKTDCSN
jgi:hypothetical protein